MTFKILDTTYTYYPSNNKGEYVVYETKEGTFQAKLVHIIKGEITVTDIINLKDVKK